MPIGQFVHFCRSIGNWLILHWLVWVPQCTLVGLPISLSLSVDDPSILQLTGPSTCWLAGCSVGRFLVSASVGSLVGFLFPLSIGWSLSWSLGWAVPHLVGCFLICYVSIDLSVPSWFFGFGCFVGQSLGDCRSALVICQWVCLLLVPRFHCPSFGW